MYCGEWGVRGGCGGVGVGVLVVGWGDVFMYLCVCVPMRLNELKWH